jgi:hypothetical protein
MLRPEDIVEWAFRREEHFRAEAEGQEPLVALVLARVLNGVWHTTSTTRFQGIVASGAILPEPPIDNSERWSTSQGKEW